jgi:Flp pilus assembly pilin Flp
MLRKFIKNTDGATVIEYAFLCVFLVLGVVAAIRTYEEALSNNFSNTTAQIP